MALSKAERDIITAIRQRLTWDRASFSAFDAAKDAEVKASTRVYLDSWIIPALSILLGEDPDDPPRPNYQRDLSLAKRLVS